MLHGVYLNGLDNLLSVLLIKRLMMIQARRLRNTGITFGTSLLRNINMALIIRTITQLTQPRALLIIIMDDTTQRVLRTIRIPCRGLLTIDLLRDDPLKDRDIRIMLIRNSTSRQVVCLNGSIMDMLRTISKRNQYTTRFSKRLSTIQLGLLCRLLRGDGDVLTSLIGNDQGNRVRKQGSGSRLTTRLITIYSSLIRLYRGNILFLLNLLRIRRSRNIMKRRLRIILQIDRPDTRVISNMLTNDSLTIRTLKLSISMIGTMLLTRIRIFRCKIIFTRAITTFIGASFRDDGSFWHVGFALWGTM